MKKESLLFPSKDILRKAGSKATPSRLAVLETLIASHAPLSIEDIARGSQRTMDTSTIYRILEAFAIAGLVRKIEFGKEKAFYEYAERPHHHHIVCNSCGDVEDIENNEMENKLGNVKAYSKKFSIITSHSLEFFGLCKSCNKK